MPYNESEAKHSLRRFTEERSERSRKLGLTFVRVSFDSFIRLIGKAKPRSRSSQLGSGNLKFLIMYKRITEKNFNCPSCNSEKSIYYYSKITNYGVEIYIQKCSNCKMQYYESDLKILNGATVKRSETKRN